MSFPNDPKYIDYEYLDANSQPGAFSIYDIEIFVPEVMKLKPNEIYLEIGVDRGRSLSIVEKVADPSVIIEGIDPILTPELETYLHEVGDRVKFWKKTSEEVSKVWDLGKISLLFIDGNHDYEFVKIDIESWYPKMEKNGVILFHDYGINKDGVKEAVDEFVSTHPEVKFYDLSNNKTSMVKIQL